MEVVFDSFLAFFWTVHAAELHLVRHRVVVLGLVEDDVSPTVVGGIVVGHGGLLEVGQISG